MTYTVTVPVIPDCPSNDRQQRNPKVFLHQCRGEGVDADRVKVFVASVFQGVQVEAEGLRVFQTQRHV